MKRYRGWVLGLWLWGAFVSGESGRSQDVLLSYPQLLEDEASTFIENCVDELTSDAWALRTHSTPFDEYFLPKARTWSQLLRGRDFVSRSSTLHLDEVRHVVRKVWRRFNIAGAQSGGELGFVDSVLAERSHEALERFHDQTLEILEGKIELNDYRLREWIRQYVLSWFFGAVKQVETEQYLRPLSNTPRTSQWLYKRHRLDSDRLSECRIAILRLGSWGN